MLGQSLTEAIGTAGAETLYKQFPTNLSVISSLVFTPITQPHYPPVHERGNANDASRVSALDLHCHQVDADIASWTSGLGPHLFIEPAQSRKRLFSAAFGEG